MTLLYIIQYRAMSDDTHTAPSSREVNAAVERAMHELNLTPVAARTQAVPCTPEGEPLP